MRAAAAEDIGQFAVLIEIVRDIETNEIDPQFISDANDVRRPDGLTSERSFRTEADERPATWSAVPLNPIPA